MNYLKMYIVFPVVLLLPTGLIAQNVVKLPLAQSLSFEENKKQWNPDVLYKTDIPGGRIFLEKNTITYSLYSISDLEKGHNHSHTSEKPGKPEKDFKIRCHAFKVKFSGANTDVVVNGKDKMQKYSNYFIGNDSSRWASFVGNYKTVEYHDLYKGIDLEVYSSGNNFKYEFIVNPNTDPSDIRMVYEGAEKLTLNQGTLVIATSVTDVLETIPYVYQEIDGVKKEIKCSYILVENQVSFDFPEGYDKNFPLVIDPVVVASTYSGSTAETWGHCATYDNQGNIYTGGRCFGQGYPVTTGAFQTSFAGDVDIAIGKLNPTGSAFIYATYIGGTSDEYAQSMITDSNGELYIYGSSASADYPVTAGCYDNSFNGSYDIVLTKLNSTGSALMGSTYMGGQDIDGLNDISYNYGDEFRGEIILDANNNPLVASFSSSFNFPTTPGAYDQSFDGGQDGVVFKMNSNLTSLTWSTFLGGSGDDAAFGLQINSVGYVYVVGGTDGNNFPTTPVVLHPNFQGGDYDGFICILQGNGSALMASTYFGTSEFDELFFVDLDANDNVYVFGLTEGNIPPTVGVYANPGSSQFITKLDPTLNTVIYSTCFGSGTISYYADFSPTAFLVDICENVYAAGWGETTGFPVSPNAVQPTTDGEDFYLMVLKKDALSLLYATYYGDPNALEHVDGGTSRFDKQGIVYEAVCAGGSQFPTTPGAVSAVNNTDWDIAVFKIDFQLGQVLADANASPNDTGCVPFTVNFINNSNGVNYLWDFDDGSPLNTQVSPSHTFSASGTYNVMLIAIDSMKCNISDTTYLTIVVTSGSVVDIGNDTTICTGATLTLDAGIPGSTYLWSTGATSQTIVINTTGTYWVSVASGDCISKDTINVTFSQSLNVNLGNDIVLCQSVNLMLDAGNPGSTYLWSTNETSQTIQVTSPGTYWVSVSDQNCNNTDTIVVSVISSPHLGEDISMCKQNQIVLDAGASAGNYLWSTGENTQTIVVTQPGIYWVQISKADCSISDTIVVNKGGSVTMYFPNTFTPDGDGLNDFFTGYGEDIEMFNMKIFDRWGQMIFETDDYSKAWDGKFEGRPVQSDIYVWIADFKTTCMSKKNQHQIGRVFVFR